MPKCFVCALVTKKPDVSRSLPITAHGALLYVLPHSKWLSFLYAIQVIDESEDTASYHNLRAVWPAPGSEDTELGVFMGAEVGHGKTTVYTGVQA